MGVGRQNFALALVSGLPLIAAAFVGLRIFARIRRRVKIGWDDWLLVFATILSFGVIPPSIIHIKTEHIGFHFWEVIFTTESLTNKDIGKLHALQLSFNLLSIPILPLAKASIIIILLKIGKVITPLRRFLQIIFIFNTAACVIPWAVYIFICPPGPGGGVTATAPRTFGNLRCLDRAAQGELLLFINCANLVTDILVFPIPFFIMRELMNTNIRSKLAIAFTFASSLCVTALSALKIYVTYRDRILIIDNPDPTYSLEFCITHGESTVGIMVACVPILRGLISSSLGLRTNHSSNRTGSNRPQYYPPGHSGSYYASATGGDTRTSQIDAQRNSGRVISTSLEDEHLLKSPDIMMTTVVERRTSPTEDLEQVMDPMRMVHVPTRHERVSEQTHGDTSDSSSDLIIQRHGVSSDWPSAPAPVVHMTRRL